MKILDFLVCEDIRHEVGNKMTLIGVIATQQLTIQLSAGEEDKWPRPTRLSVFLRLKIEETEVIPDKFDLQFIYKDKVISNVKGEVPAPPSPIKLSNINLALTSNNFPIPGPGKITFRLDLFSKDEHIFNGAPDYALSINVLSQAKIAK